MFDFPKIFHLYCDGSSLSFLNLITILSFNKFHFGWKIYIHMPKERTLKENNIKKYEGIDYFNYVYKIKNVIVNIVDFDEIGFTNHAHEVIKSDYLRYYVLYKYGGVWSDFDIIYLSSIEENIVTNKETVIFLDRIGSYEYFPIGFFLSKPNSKFFGHLLNNIDKSLNYFSQDYQVIGSLLFRKLFNNKENIKNCDTEISSAKCYLPFNCTEISSCLLSKNFELINKLKQNVFGIHWFNGDTSMKTYINNLDKRINKSNFSKEFFLDFFVDIYFKELDNILS